MRITEILDWLEENSDEYGAVEIETEGSWSQASAGDCMYDPLDGQHSLRLTWVRRQIEIRCVLATWCKSFASDCNYCGSVLNTPTIHRRLFHGNV